MYFLPFLTLTDIPIECSTKSIFPLKISRVFKIKFSRSSTLVASAGIISELVSSANLFILPILKATGALVSTKSPPCSLIFTAVLQAIEFSSSAPKIIPFLPFNKLLLIFFI